MATQEDPRGRAVCLDKVIAVMLCIQDRKYQANMRAMLENVLVTPEADDLNIMRRGVDPVLTRDQFVFRGELSSTLVYIIRYACDTSNLVGICEGEGAIIMLNTNEGVLAMKQRVMGQAAIERVRAADATNGTSGVKAAPRAVAAPAAAASPLLNAIVPVRVDEVHHDKAKDMNTLLKVVEADDRPVINVDKRTIQHTVNGEAFTLYFGRLPLGTRLAIATVGDQHIKKSGQMQIQPVGFFHAMLFRHTPRCAPR